MEYLAVFIAIMLVLLVVLLLYVAVSWTLWRKTRQRREEESTYKHLPLEEDVVHAKVAEVYAQENMPKFSITAVQPRPEFPAKSLGSDDDDEGEDDDQNTEDLSDQRPDLGRLYFSLRYDPHRSVLIVCLARAEDIPVEPEASGTFIDVHLLPLKPQSQTFHPYDTSISVSFREVYEFPLTKHELAVQTLDFHICRYDSFSRRTSLGDVFLALAELGAQGIDLSREVFLCRNIISSQQVYSAVQRKETYETDEDHEEVCETGKQKKSRGSRQESGSPWKILKDYVRSGKYKRFFGLETMTWEPLFTQRSIVDETGFYSALDTPLKAPGEKDSEGSSSFTFPPRETHERRGKSSASSQTSPLQISPAPKDYYKIVPITPHQSCQTSRQSSVHAPQSHSRESPESRDDDDMTRTSTPVLEKKARGGRPRKKTSKGMRRKTQVSGSTGKKLTSPRGKKSSQSSEKRPGRGKSTSSASSLKAFEKTSSQSSLSSDSSSSLSESLRVSAEPSETPGGIRESPFLPPSFARCSSIDTDEFRTPLPSPFLELRLGERRQSDPYFLARRASAARVRRTSSTGDVGLDKKFPEHDG